MNKLSQIHPLWIHLAGAIAFMFALMVSFGCATTPRGRAVQVAVAQKTAADGLGNAYLDYCEEVRRSACIAADEAAQEAGKPQTKADRVACLRPCDSATAERFAEAVEIVRAAQLALFAALKTTEPDAVIEEKRAALADAARALLELAREAGIDALLAKVFGP